MARTIANSPTALIANRINDGDAHIIYQTFQLMDDERTAGPRTGEGNVEVVPTGNGWIQS